MKRVDIEIESHVRDRSAQAQGPWTDLALHTLGWKAFQDLCASTCEEILGIPVEIYREAQDGGQDAAFIQKPDERRKEQRPVTIQCKFTSKASLRLRLSDVRQEEAHIEELRSKGQVDTYILMTNMSVDAPVAVNIKHRLRELGVLRPHVFGREFLTRVIRSSAKLRALVPRVYGLGDLSLILDERRAAQTKALLGHMMPTLTVYVPTTPHVQAVRTLGKHHIVLLLGNPATGKSTIAAILATMASEKAGRPCYKSEGPEGLLDSWNPNDPSGFFWVDDAFGPNQLRDDFTDRWISIMPKVQAAMAEGNHFVLTSRRHIYEAAKPKLGSRNHPLFRGGEAVVTVGNLSAEERQQILYNHIKAGKQSRYWKGRVKPQLGSLANEPALLPEIARRLGDPAFTTKISTANDMLLSFIREPREHLLQTIEELSKLHRAALTLVFLHRGYMPVGSSDPEMQQLVMKHFSVDAESLWHSLSHLRDSFLVVQTVNNSTSWTFKHPTIADAISDLLGRTEGLGELYLRGTKSETIIAECVCAGAHNIPDAVTVPASLNNLLVERLAEIPDEKGLNRRLFSFLSERASDDVFCLFISQYRNVLRRIAYGSSQNRFDPTILIRARAHSFGQLPNDLREGASYYLEESLISNADTSFLDDDNILALVKPSRLLRLRARIRDELLTKFPDMATSVADDADLDEEPDSNFDDLRSKLGVLEDLFEEDVTTADLFSEASSAIDYAVKSVTEKKEDKERQKEMDENDDWNWHRAARPPSSISVRATSASFDGGKRSIFSDVDE